MLFKGFNQHSKLAINQSPTANYDVQKFIFKHIGKVATNASNKMRTRCSIGGISFMRSKHPSNYFIGTNKICIRDSLFNKGNWEIRQHGRCFSSDRKIKNVSKEL